MLYKRTFVEVHLNMWLCVVGFQTLLLRFQLVSISTILLSILWSRCCDDIGFYLSVVMYKCITQRTRINFYRQYWKRQLFFLFKRKQCFVRVISLLLTPPEERKWLPEWPVVVDSIQHVLWHQQDNDWLTSSDKNTWITLCSLNYRMKKRKDKLSAGPWLASLG